MNIKKPLLAVGAVAAVGLASATGVGIASAATAPGEGTLVDKIASRLDMPRGEVKAVLDEEKTVRQIERQQSIEERLSELVKAGKLTEEQKTKLLAKQAELHAARQAEFEAMKGKSKDEARTQLKDHREELKAWATANGISEEQLELIAGTPIGAWRGSSDAAGGGAAPAMVVHETN